MGCAPDFPCTKRTHVSIYSMNSDIRCSIPLNWCIDRAMFYIRAFRSLSALVITETELKLMAAAAMIGLSSRPKNG